MVARPHLQKLADRARLLPPLPAAIVYPCDRDSLQLALSGAFAGFLAPVLVGPESRIRDVAASAGLEIARLPVVDTADDSEAAGLCAANLARIGVVRALVRGMLGNDDLLKPVVAMEDGLRGDHRLSHAYFLDLPGRASGLVLTDAYMNVAPNLAAKRDIVHNAVRLAAAIGIATPRVALLAAMNGPAPAFPSTREAIALKSMAQQGIFGPAIADGPLAPDSALSAEAARANGITSEVAGRADILFGPTMEASLMVLRTLQAVTGCLAAGVILGARVPIVVPARNDPIDVRIASCVLASLLGATLPEYAAPVPVAAATEPLERAGSVTV